ncbi:ABC transporter substrate-binding protein [Niameybacter massiliensis]|uniref:ABC transporter substrate-binding protein n=1 Tax=Niameybacter massiliensis TaxID=1658108 RepID=UPI000AEE8136|nr:ABC transporter substrate-binding protein [Niameybacter massiliensis]
MKTKRLFAMGLAMMMSSMSFVGCQQSGGNGDTIRIGASFDLTGSCAQYGIAASNGAKLAIEEYNAAGSILGKQIDFILEDNKANQQDATNAFKKLVENDKVVAFIGSDISSTTETIAHLAAEKNIPMITPTGTKEGITAIGNNIFRACYIDPAQGELLAKFATEDLSATKVAMLVNSESDYSSGIAEAFEELFVANGGEIVRTEKYGSNDVDFKPILTNIKNANPEVIVIPDYYETIANIATQAREIGITATLIGGDGWDGVTEKTVNNPEVVEGSYFVNHYTVEDTSDIVQNFITSYKGKYNEEPNAFAALGYDAARIMLEAIKTAGSTEADAVVAAMQNTSLACVTGDVTFDENRNPVKSVSVIRIENGENKLYKKLDAVK